MSAFRAFRTDVRNAFATYQSPTVFLDVLLSWGTTRFAAVKVQHDPRRVGKSNYTLRKLLRMATMLLTGFSTAPLRFATFVGFVFTVFGTGVLAYVVIISLVRGSVPGFPFLASIVSLFSGAQLFALGIIGEYLAVIHVRLMERPVYVIREQVESDAQADASRAPQQRMPLTTYVPVRVPNDAGLDGKLGVAVTGRSTRLQVRDPMKVCVACAQPFSSPTWVCPTCGSTPPVVGGHLAFAPELAVQGSGFKEEYFAGLAALEERNFWFRSRNRLLAWSMRRHFPKAETFLEIGCGNGYVLWGLQRALPKLKLAGSEIFSAGLEFAAQRVPDVELFQMDATNIPYRDEFDVIGAFDVLEHIAPDELVLAQMHQAVKPGGGILITVPQHMSLWSQADEEAMHQRRYSAREMRQKVERAGIQGPPDDLVRFAPAPVDGRAAQAQAPPQRDVQRPAGARHRRRRQLGDGADALRRARHDQGGDATSRPEGHC